MSPTVEKFDAATEEMLSEIRKVFGKVERGEGETLHETLVIDDYGNQEERHQARRRDTDCHWWEVRDEWIEEFEGVGGLSFLDATGFRYYCPAYMSFWLRRKREPNSFAFQLQSEKFWKFDSLFSPEEKELIAKFLNHVWVHLHNQNAGKAFDKVWKRYLEVSGEE
jgi:hypothetical protein